MVSANEKSKYNGFQMMLPVVRSMEDSGKTFLKYGFHDVIRLVRVLGSCNIIFITY